VYRLYGYVGYQIDIEFARGERFKGLAAGNIEGIAFKADGRHLFIKPRVAHLRTNLTVLTNRRAYEFDYSVSSGVPDSGVEQVIYALRFTYPHPPMVTVPHMRQRIAADLARGPSTPRNYDYWYCGSPSLKPEAVWDNGVQTWIRFEARQALPAIFVLGADGSESLVNFSVHRDDVVVQRVVRRLVLRRGKLKGCIVNKALRGGRVRLKSGTITPKVERVADR
jgi:type IV secretion system protein VirB9